MQLETHGHVLVVNKGFHALKIACGGVGKARGETIPIGNEVSIRLWSVSLSNLTETRASICDPISNMRKDQQCTK